MYTMKSRIRFSEVDADGKLSWLGLVDYLQDIATEQSELLHVGVDFLKQTGHAWIMLSWQICVNRMPGLAEEIELRTLPYEMRGFYGRRNFQMLAADGEVLVTADSIWVYMDMEKGRPGRIPAAITEIYQLDEKLPMNYFGRKLKLPEKQEAKDPVQVLSYFIDTNHHTNNSKYIMLAQSYLPENYPAKELRVEYRTSAMLGDLLYPLVGELPNGISVNLADADGNPYAIVQFLE